MLVINPLLETVFIETNAIHDSTVFAPFRNIIAALEESGNQWMTYHLEFKQHIENYTRIISNVLINYTPSDVKVMLIALVSLHVSRFEFSTYP